MSSDNNFAEIIIFFDDDIFDDAIASLTFSSIFFGMLYPHFLGIFLMIGLIYLHSLF